MPTATATFFAVSPATPDLHRQQCNFNATDLGRSPRGSQPAKQPTDIGSGTLDASHTRELAGSAELEGLVGGFQQDALLGVHGDGLGLRHAEEGVVKQLHAVHKAAKALVGRNRLKPPRVHIPPAASYNIAHFVIVV